jgi:hypothetical protein
MVSPMTSRTVNIYVEGYLTGTLSSTMSHDSRRNTR